MEIVLVAAHLVRVELLLPNNPRPPGVLNIPDGIRLMNIPT